MIKFESVAAHDGVNLRVARFEPAGDAIGVMQIVHGFGEGLVHYKEIASFFAMNGYACIVHDQRGFGEMPDLPAREREKGRGVAKGYDYLIEDIRTLRVKIDEWYPDLPVVLFGHSMGGNLVANYLIRHAGDALQYDKAVLEAPWLRLYKPLPKFATAVAGLLGKVSPKITISARINLEDISRNADIINGLRSDGVYHNRMSLRLYAAIVAAGEFATQNAAKISIPTLLLCPGGDKIVCPEAIREFSRNAGDNVTLVEFPDAYHCLHADTVYVEVVGAIMDFVRG